jgi:2-polyprenyl-3-methyl-5-hydroxy-6-metoxy-1,4-benzoquinol methylase
MIFTRIFEDIKRILNLYNYDEYIKNIGIKNLLKIVKKNNLNFINKHCIDLGGGNGLVGYRLKKLGFKPSLTILDNYATPAFGHNYIKQKIENFESKKKYEIVFCLLVLELVDSRAAILKKIKDILHEEGVAVLSIPNFSAPNVNIWKKKASKKNSNLSKLFLKKQKEVMIDRLEKEALKQGLLMQSKFAYGYLPQYATNTNTRLRKKIYIDLNEELKGYLEPSYYMISIRHFNK